MSGGSLFAHRDFRAALLATIPLAAILDRLTMTQLVIVALLTGFTRVFFDVGYQSYIPSVIGRDRVLAGNSAMETMRASGQFVGPGRGRVARRAGRGGQRHPDPGRDVRGLRRGQ